MGRLRLSRAVLPALAAAAPEGERRSLRAGDVLPLARLMLAAYRGGVDDEGETEADAIGVVRDTFAGRVGPFLAHASFGHWRDGALVAAIVVTRFENEPLIAFCVTEPAHAGQGHATALMAAALGALHAAGDTRVRLYVNPANVGAIRLYRRLGFAEA